MKNFLFRAYGDMNGKPFLFTPFYAERALFDKVFQKRYKKIF